MHGQPRPARYLSATMHDALATAAKHGHVGLRRLHKPDTGKPPWPANANTLHALVRRELLRHERARHRNGWPMDRWTITDLGRTALEPVDVVKRDRPVYLARSGGQMKYRKLSNGRWAIDGSADGNGDYTTDASQSIDNDLRPGSTVTVAVEVLVGPEELDVFARKAQEREQDRLREEGDRLDTLPIAHRIELAAQSALDSKMDASRQLRLIRFMDANGRQNDAARKLADLEAHLKRRAA